MLHPRGTWDDAAAYDRQARQLAEMFAKNFEKYEDEVSNAILAAGPQVGMGV